MSEASDTRASLLVRVRNPHDAQAWAQFVDLYGPLIYGVSRRRGLQDADAADVTQDVLRSVARAVQKLDYQPGGSFRGWLYTVTRNRLNDWHAAQQRREHGSGDTEVQRLLEAQPVPEADDWEQEYQRRVFAWAAEQVRGEFAENTWRAFWLTAVEGKPGAEVSETLGLSLGAVYVARSRVLARLKEAVRPLLEE